MFRRSALVLVLALFAPSEAVPAGRPNSGPNLAAVHPDTTWSIASEANQILEWGSRGIPTARDAAARQCDIVVRNAEGFYRTSADSIRHDTWNSLGRLRRDSLTALHGVQLKTIEGFRRQKRQLLDSLSRVFSIRASTLAAGRFDGPAELRKARNDLQSEWAGALQEFCEEFQTVLQDSVETLRDEFSAVADALAERESDEQDERENSSHLTAGAGYTSRITYRGVDGGATSQALVPSLAYKFRFGLSLTGTAYRLLGTDAQWDEAEFGASFEHTLIGGLSGSIAFTQYLFAGTSTSIIAELKNDISAGISYDAGAVYPSTTVVMAFGGGQTDIYWGTGLSGHIPLLQSGPGTKLSLDPGVSMTLGTQSLVSQTVLKRNAKAQGQGKGKGVGQGGGAATTESTSISASKSVFAVTAYDFSIPLRFEYKSFFAVTAAAIAVPMNQPAGVSDAAFGYFTLTIGAII